jgi:hypothetical protein
MHRFLLPLWFTLAACGPNADDTDKTEVNDSDEGDTESPVVSDTEAGDTEVEPGLNRIPVALGNASFEYPQIGVNGFTSNCAGAWTFAVHDGMCGYGLLYPAEGDLSEREPLAAPAAGQQMLYANCQAPQTLTFSQSLPVTLGEGWVIEVSAAVGRRLTVGAPGGELRLVRNATSTVLASVTLPEAEAGGWELVTLSHTVTAADAGAEAHVEVYFASEGSGLQQGLIDAITVEVLTEGRVEVPVLPDDATWADACSIYDGDGRPTTGVGP